MIAIIHKVSGAIKARSDGPILLFTIFVLIEFGRSCSWQGTGGWIAVQTHRKIVKREFQKISIVPRPQFVETQPWIKLLVVAFGDTVVDAIKVIINSEKLRAGNLSLESLRRWAAEELNKCLALFQLAARRNPEVFATNR